jgi:hypothetical protein
MVTLSQANNITCIIRRTLLQHVPVPYSFYKVMLEDTYIYMKIEDMTILDYTCVLINIGQYSM